MRICDIVFVYVDDNWCVCVCVWIISSVSRYFLGPLVRVSSVTFPSLPLSTRLSRIPLAVAIKIHSLRTSFGTLAASVKITTIPSFCVTPYHLMHTRQKCLTANADIKLDIFCPTFFQQACRKHIKKCGNVFWAEIFSNSRSASSG